MRSFLVLSLSATFLTGCLTSQENPNYQHSTTYRGDVPAQNQYANAPQAPITYQSASGDYQSANGNYQTYAGAPAGSVSIDSPEAQRIFAQTGSTDSAFLSAASVAPAPTAPTDSLYSGAEVTGTPGFMALQSAQQEVTTPAVTTQVASQSLPAAQYVAKAPLGAAGTPIEYDYSRNIIDANSITTEQSLPETVRLVQGGTQNVQGAGHNYVVQQGDTVYGLSRKTCVGVSVIQSMNGLSPNFAIKIGQSLTLPTSVC